MKIKFAYYLTLFGATILFGCMSPSQHAEEVQRGIEGEKITVGTVQREIKNGMSGAEVIQVLGSPNIVSTDEKGREVWVYDKISTDRVYSTSSGGVSTLILGGGVVGGAGILGGGVGAGYGRGAGAQSTSQRTLTIIIKFDDQKKVRKFAYHSSRF
jgi:outer membrane protein assembly factor BamE (lipoprotein component of BamABCDE complex)